MAIHRIDGAEQPGLHWGPFTLRVPFYHTRVEWPELLQGVFIAAATGLALVPLLTAEFGLTFEEAVACIVVETVLIGSAPILFGEPYAPGWITPALPLVLVQVLALKADGTPLYPTAAERFQFMTATSIDFAALVFFLGITGLGSRFIDWLPPSLKGGIIMGAAIAALKRVFLDDAETYLDQQPVATTLALAVCLILTFSVPVRRLRRRHTWLGRIAGLGLLPGFLMAAAAGPALGELEFKVEWGILLPPFSSFFNQVTPFSIGWPDGSLFLAGLPLALMSYIILFGDLITGREILREAMNSRPDERIILDSNRSHHSIAIRNLLMALAAPFFPTQGCLWTGVHIIIVQRWREGRQQMESLFGGIASYYVFGLPILYFVRPLVSVLRPLMGIAFSLTLVLTGFACAFVSMALPKTPIERGVILLTGVSLAVFDPWMGLGIGILSTLTLVGLKNR